LQSHTVSSGPAVAMVADGAAVGAALTTDGVVEDAGTDAGATEPELELEPDPETEACAAGDGLPAPHAAAMTAATTTRPNARCVGRAKARRARRAECMP